MNRLAWWLVMGLLLANVCFATWSQGWWADWGWQPVDPREPDRVLQQLNPQALTLRPPAPTQASRPSDSP